MSFEIASTEILYLVGTRNVGKSHLLRKLIPNFSSVVVYDASTYQHGDLGAIARNPNELRELLKQGKSPIVVQPDYVGYSDDASVEVFNACCKVIWEQGNVFFAIEELGDYCRNGLFIKWFDKIVRVGRNRGIGLCGLNQRPVRISTNFVALIEKWFVFRLQMANDLEFVTEYFGDEWYDVIRNLQQGEFIYMSSLDMKPVRCKPV